MEVLRGLIGKGDNKDKRSRQAPDTASAYRSSDASGEPDVGTKRYSRDAGSTRDNDEERRQNERETSSSYRGEDTSGSRDARSMGLGRERSVTGDSGYDRDQSSYSTLSGEEDSSRDVSRRDDFQEYSRRSDDDLDDSNTATGSYGLDDPDAMDSASSVSGGVHHKRGERSSHSGRSSRYGMSRDNSNQMDGSYVVDDDNFDKCNET
ncbi:hypothetical protein PsorP6_016859 [Peronosclerospora sorghi]|uniref:Uncharacterized protein n=1 Tax=Peronosclerospora sorghi TaxID=230839 RepID=A0ACC0WE24_9STRA|nr:hypothetical protein PsorP6_016859 [Peronosclerospora sorghi]